MRPIALRWSSLLALLAVLTLPAFALAESGGPAEFSPGQVSGPQASRSPRQARIRMYRALAATHAAEIDSLGVLAATAPPEAVGRWQREIEAAKQRHARQEIGLQRDFAIREGNAALVRRLDTRLARLAAVTGGAR